MIRPLAQRLARQILAKEITSLRTSRDWLRDHAERLETSLAEAEAEIDRLRQRAGRDTPTPLEATVLAIVTENPGMTAGDIGEMRWRTDPQVQSHDKMPWYARQYATAPLRSLLLKGYVRREPTTGGTFRYWPASAGGAS